MYWRYIPPLLWIYWSFFLWWEQIKSDMQESIKHFVRLIISKAFIILQPEGLDCICDGHCMAVSSWYCLCGSGNIEEQEGYFPFGGKYGFQWYFLLTLWQHNMFCMPRVPCMSVTCYRLPVLFRHSGWYLFFIYVKKQNGSLLIICLHF